MSIAERRVFTGSMNEVATTARWLDSIAMRKRIPGASLFAMQICAEEILSNIVRHSGRSAPKVEVGVSISPEKIVLTIEDDGEPFNVAQANPQKLNGDIESVIPGGLGLGLVQNFANALEYSRGPSGNHLRVTIDVSPSIQNLDANTSIDEGRH